MAEGFRKLALLWLLIRNGTIYENSILFWDEPEANLNPTLVGKVIEILLELQRLRVQIFVATHNYVVLKELDLRSSSQDRTRYHSLYREEPTREIVYHSVDNFEEVDPNLIVDTLADLYDREVERALGGKK